MIEQNVNKLINNESHNAKLDETNEISQSKQTVLDPRTTQELNLIETNIIKTKKTDKNYKND